MYQAKIGQESLTYILGTIYSKCQAGLTYDFFCCIMLKH